MPATATSPEPPAPPTGGWIATSSAGRAVLDAAAADPDGTLLAMDLDGTLAPIVEDPDDAEVLPQARAALELLNNRVATLAVITGRPVRRARQMLDLDRPGLDRIVILGQYGVESYDAATGRMHIPEAPPVVEQARRRLEHAVVVAASSDPGTVGTMVEVKEGAVALHTRRAADRELAWSVLAPTARRLGRELGLFIEEGREVVELTAWHTTKADALTGLVERTRPSTVLMCGDDLGDLPALDVVAGLIEKGGHGARVVSWSAEQPTVAGRADVLCDAPPGVARFLEELARRIGAEHLGIGE
ncbi:trehalose-phosphatase [Acidipropionibacterium virtanenii]|uniref:trehalose-phosphatase n=1 Tax=Acidipropionibacterium virtanenii TaxID=2057246 RepID=UPI0015F03E59|nr:trehalose-phosphatase [Acidipropionibacterium virtanenii]